MPVDGAVAIVSATSVPPCQHCLGVGALACGDVVRVVESLAYEAGRVTSAQRVVLVPAFACHVDQAGQSKLGEVLADGGAGGSDALPTALRAGCRGTWGWRR